ncbi:MAG: SPFH domain-containing protein [Chloroflexota bacterium]
MDLLPLIVVVAVVVVVVGLLFGSGMLANVGGQQVGVIERRYFGRPLPEGRVVAMKGEIGIQARVLQPGLHVLKPFLYKVSKVPMLVVPEDQVGLIESIDGSALDPGHIFARRVASHDTFQDGEAFLRNGGQKGPQVDILAPGTYRINTYLFRVTLQDAVIIAQGQVGTVNARDGGAIQPGRLLARKTDGHQAFQDGEAFLANGGERGPQIEVVLPGRYRINTALFRIEVQPATIVQANQVGLITAKDGQPLPARELVAASITGHADFQDASAFLANGGQRGPQFDLLKPGTYYINPLMFEVKLDNVITVQRGEVAVLVSNVGHEPDDIPDAERLQGKERYVVPAGYRGIQAEVAGPGVYYLNRWAYIAYLIPTTNITIDWADESGTLTAEDAEAAVAPTDPLTAGQAPANRLTSSIATRRAQLFNPLSVISREGFEMRVGVKVVIRVRPEQAPLMVAKIGSIENLIDHVVHPMIDSSFRNQASSSEAMNFMQDRADEQAKAEERTREELEKYHVECVSVLISQIILPAELMDIHTRRVIAAQQQDMYVEQQKSEAKRIDTENTRARADKQAELVSAQISVSVAEQTKQRTILEAEGRARATVVEGEAEATKVAAVGTATAEAYEKQVAAVGRGNLAGIEVTKAIASAGLRITPDIQVTGEDGGNGNGIFNAFIAQLLASNQAAAAAGVAGAAAGAGTGSGAASGAAASGATAFVPATAGGAAAAGTGFGSAGEVVSPVVMVEPAGTVDPSTIVLPASTDAGPDADPGTGRGAVRRRGRGPSAG